MVRLTVITPFWRRHETGERMMARVAALRDELADEVTITALAVISEPHWQTVAPRHGWDVVWAENDPRHRKIRVGFAKVGAEVHPDAVLALGSDDFIDAAYVRAAVDALTRGIDLWGVTDIYFRDGGALWWWPGYPATSYRHGETLGTGRMMSRRFLDACAWDPWRGQEDDHGPVLTACEAGMALEGVTMADAGVALVDVKEAGSSTALSALRGLVAVSQPEAQAVLASVGLAPRPGPR